jgi:serine/threonine-protein kinase
VSGDADRKLELGDRLGDYELLCPVGEGGMASVWIARLVRKYGFQKLVALKTILPKFADEEHFREMFFDEARIASQVEHPSVVHIHDLNEQDGVLFLVMEYVEGHALTMLRKKIKKDGGEFPVAVAARVIADACGGLHAAHDLHAEDGSPLNIVHRDVSPQNVLVSTVGVSKVIDFGVAKSANRIASHTHTGLVKGKVQYMAPEQALAKPVDRRADVWGAGATLYHLVSGQYPFNTENHLELLTRLQQEEPPSPLPDSIPLPIVAIIQRALTHDPAKRFQTTDELRMALEDSGHIATHAEVAQCLLDHLGAETEKRRNTLAKARVALELKKHAAYDDDLMPTTPHARAPQIDPSALEITQRRPAKAPPTVQQTLPLGQAPPEILALHRKAVPQATTRIPSSPNLLPIEGTTDLPSRAGTSPSSSNMQVPIEGPPDMLSRTGYGTNAGVRPSLPGIYVAPPQPKGPPSWLIALAAGGGFIAAAIVIMLVLKHPKPIEPPPPQASAVQDAGAR